MNRDSLTPPHGETSISIEDLLEQLKDTRTKNNSPDEQLSQILETTLDLLIQKQQMDIAYNVTAPERRILEVIIQHASFPSCMALQIVDTSGTEARSILRQKLFSVLQKLKLYRPLHLATERLRDVRSNDSLTTIPVDVPIHFVQESMLEVLSGKDHTPNNVNDRWIFLQSFVQQHRQDRRITNSLLSSILLQEDSNKFNRTLMHNSYLIEILTLLLSHASFESFLLGQQQQNRRRQQQLSYHQIRLVDGLCQIGTACFRALTDQTLLTSPTALLIKAFLIHVPFDRIYPQGKRASVPPLVRTGNNILLALLESTSKMTDDILIECLGGRELPDGSRSLPCSLLTHFFDTPRHIEYCLSLLQQQKSFPHGTTSTYLLALLQTHVYYLCGHDAMWNLLLQNVTNASVPITSRLRILASFLQGRRLYLDCSPNSSVPLSRLQRLPDSVFETLQQTDITRGSSQEVIELAHSLARLVSQDWLHFAIYNNEFHLLIERLANRALESTSSTKVKLEIGKSLADIAAVVFTSKASSYHLVSICTILLSTFQELFENNSNANIRTAMMYGIGNLGYNLGDPGFDFLLQAIPFPKLSEMIQISFNCKNEKLRRNVLRAGAIIASLWKLHSSESAFFIERFLRVCKEILVTFNDTEVHSRKSIQAATDAANALGQFYRICPTDDLSFDGVRECEKCLWVLLNRPLNDKLTIAVCRSLRNLQSITYVGTRVSVCLGRTKSKDAQNEFVSLLHHILGKVNSLEEAKVLKENLSRDEWIELYDVMAAWPACPHSLFGIFRSVQDDYELEELFASRSSIPEDEDEL